MDESHSKKVSNEIDHMSQKIVEMIFELFPDNSSLCLFCRKTLVSKIIVLFLEKSTTSEDYKQFLESFMSVLRSVITINIETAEQGRKDETII
jgi:hypothetical protein